MTETRPVLSTVMSGLSVGGSSQYSHSVRKPMDECSVLRGISQSTAFVGVTPGDGLRTILLLRRFRVTGLPCDVRVEVAGGGGRFDSLMGLPGSENVRASSSGTVGSVGRPLYGEEGESLCEEWTGDFAERTDPGRDPALFLRVRTESNTPSSRSTLPSRHVLPPPLPRSLLFVCASSERPLDRVRGWLRLESAIWSTGMFSLDSLERARLGVRGARRGEEVDRCEPGGGGEVDDARAGREGRGETDVYRDEMCEDEGDALCVWAICLGRLVSLARRGPMRVRCDDSMCGRRMRD